MKQTAVEWLVHELDKQMIERDKFDAFDWIFEDLIKEAQKMEKQQIIDALITSEVELLSWGISAEQYYNKTFKNSEQ